MSNKISKGKPSKTQLASETSSTFQRPEADGNQSSGWNWSLELAGFWGLNRAMVAKRFTAWSQGLNVLLLEPEVAPDSRLPANQKQRLRTWQPLMA